MHHPFNWRQRLIDLYTRPECVLVSPSLGSPFARGEIPKIEINFIFFAYNSQTQRYLRESSYKMIRISILPQIIMFSSFSPFHRHHQLISIHASYATLLWTCMLLLSEKFIMTLNYFDRFGMPLPLGSSKLLFFNFFDWIFFVKLQVIVNCTQSGKY